jgi:crotonobetainyl-CoA:carnitine CoA-transferase CaiB-like acyl-CoA transferase
MTSGPLDRIRVPELSSGLRSRSASALLAGLGAEVLVVDGPDETYRPDHPVRVWADQHKTLTGLTLGAVGDAAAVRRLADEVEVVVAEGVPGHLERFGLDPVTVRNRNPKAVHLWMPGLGIRGGWSHLESDPLLLAAASGFAANHPSWSGRPVAPVVPTFCYLHGALGAAAAIAGLVGRQRSGDGSSVVRSGPDPDAMGAVLATLMIEPVDGDPVVSPRRSPRGGPFYRMYQAPDGRWLYHTALSPAIFFRALDVIGRMDLMVREDVAGDFSRLVLPDIADAVNEELEATFASRTPDEWIHLPRDADVPVAPAYRRARWDRPAPQPAQALLADAGRPEYRVGGRDFLGSDPAGPFYPTRDGWLAIAARSDEENCRFRDAVGDTDLEAVTGAENLIDWLDRLAAAGVPAAPVLPGTTALHDADLLANDFSHVVEVDGLGRYRIVRGHSDWSGAAGLVAESGPVGCHPVPVLTGLGLEPDEMAACSAEPW